MPKHLSKQLPKQTPQPQGFTLIEVVLVLAIGGLIFLLAFLAFQQVSENRRQSQRRQHARQILAEAVNFTSDSGGQPPCYESSTWGCGSGSWTIFYNNYFKNLDLKDPSTGTAPSMLGWNGMLTTNLSSWQVAANRPTGEAGYAIKAQCENNSLVTRPTSYLASQFGVSVKISAKNTYCVDNS